MNNTKGHTLIELMISLLVFAIAIGISSYAFQQLVKKSSQQGRTAETGVAGIVGLEMMRTDISHAGYGLPSAFQAAPVYTEVTSSPVSGFEVNATTLNDSTTASKIPRAIVSTHGSSGIDYLVIKGTNLGMNQTAKRWNFINYSGNNKSYSTYRQPSAGDPNSDTNLKAGDLAVSIRSTFTTQGEETRTLMGIVGAYSYTVPTLVSNRFTANNGSAGYQPTTPTDSVIAYGVSTGSIGMPYNRVDYYVDKNPAILPASCASGTGVLYKAVANHTTNGFDKYPLLDCVGDMQLVYERDVNGDGSLITPIGDDVIVTMTDTDIRTQIRVVRVYILTHEGKKDTNFSYPPLDATNAICVAPMNGSTCSSTGRLWTQAAMASTFGTSWKNYRWKVYSFTVTLKNL